MIESIIKNYPSLKSMVSDGELVIDVNNNRTSKETIKEYKSITYKVSVNLPNDNEINTLKYFLQVLNQIKYITNDLSGSNYVLGSIIYPAIYRLIHTDFKQIFDPKEKH